MANKLDSIKSDHLLQAFHTIDHDGIPKDNEWNLYWLKYAGKLYPFKYTVELASSYTDTPLMTTDFQSNEGYRKYISFLGFAIQYLVPAEDDVEPNFWVGASHYGPYGQTDQLNEFLNEDRWATDHYLDGGEGLAIYKKLKKIKINDRIAVRYLAKQNNTIRIAAVGTVTSINEIKDGVVSVKWDYNPFLYRGEKPSGAGAGDWWKTLTPITRPEDIEMIFGYSKNNKRAARLTWNDNGYIMPSGRTGKSKNDNCHEGRYGYGHEEWLLDNSKIIDGYHYGFLEPIRKHQEAYIDKTYDVWLYTINSDSKMRYWVGEIKNVEVISAELAGKIKQEYEDSGWLKEMEDQIRLSGANDNGFSAYNGLDLFNIRYLPESLKVNDPYLEIPEENPIVEVSRYSFLFMKDKYKIAEEDISKPFIYVQPGIIAPATNGKPKRTSSLRAPKSVEIVYIHKAISEKLTLKLRSEYGNQNVNPEHTAGYGQKRVDIVVNAPIGLIFYEIKTYNSLMTSIREAIGQLMEYALWPDQLKAKKMIVVTQTKVSEEARKYFKYLRNQFKLPIYYQSFNLKDDQLSEEF